MRLVRLALLLVSLSAPLHGQELLVHEKPVKLRHLAGNVVDPRGFALAYAAIELRSAEDHHILATTFADAKGKFFFRDLKRGDQLEIRASVKGFNIVQYAVEMSLVGKTHLKMVLPPAA